MALDWENINHWEAGEVALLTLIAALLAILCSMLLCIIYYGKVYHTLKRNEGKPLFSEGGDGPAYNSTARPHSYRADSSDSNEDDLESQQNNLNMTHKDMRKSLGRDAHQIYNRTSNMMRYNTAGTTMTNQSASTDSDSQTGTGSTTDESHYDTNTNDESTQNHSHIHQYKHHNHHNDISNTNDEDDDIGIPINQKNIHHSQMHHQQQHNNGYNFINSHSHAQHMYPPNMGYGNEMMQQQLHNKMVSHQPPPPPGAMHNININQHNNRQSNSNTIATSLSSITATEPRDRHSNKQQFNTIDDHINVNNNKYTPSPKQQLI